MFEVRRGRAGEERKKGYRELLKSGGDERVFIPGRGSGWQMSQLQRAVKGGRKLRLWGSVFDVSSTTPKPRASPL
jgi:hypothetical protein